MGKRLVSDGTEHDAHVLFTELVRCELVDGVVYVTGQSNNYRRNGAMTLAYTKALYLALGRCLAEAEGETGIEVEDVSLRPPKKPGGDVEFVLMDARGDPIVRGLVSSDAAIKAQRAVGEMLSGPIVVGLKQRR